MINLHTNHPEQAIAVVLVVVLVVVYASTFIEEAAHIHMRTAAGGISV
jgi:hypothetical protein